MKRISVLIFMVIIALSLVAVAFASDIENSTREISKSYIEEKIVPILMGVATSVIALLGTLKSIFNALKSLKESKLCYDKEISSVKEKARKELDEIKEKYEEIKTLIDDTPRLSMQIEELNNQAKILSCEIANMSKITSLGFSKERELIKNGSAREIVRLSDKCVEMAENETI